MKFVGIFIIFFVLGLFGVVGYKILTTKPTKDGPIVPLPIKTAINDFSIELPPTDSIKGNIISSSGEIYWISRIATDEAKLTTKTLQQGESIRTAKDGSLTIEFPTQAQIQVNNETQIDFAQTLPVSFLINIASGSANVKKLEKPVSIRAMHLLIRQNSGELEIGVDSENALINLNIKSGSITTSYNDLNLVTHTNDFNVGKVIFNNATRSF